MMTTLPAPVSAALSLLLEYHEELRNGGEPVFPHEADRIVKEYQEELTQRVEALREKAA